MSIFYVTRHGVVMAALGVAGALGVMMQPAAVATAADGRVGCDIQLSRSGGLVGFKAVVNAANATSGSYRLRVVSTGANSSTINQSGDFTVSGGSSVVSTVSLGGSGSYTARLAITVDGRTAECSRSIGGSL